MIKKIDLSLLAIFVWPILLLLINNNWIFTSVTQGLIDPWVYLGYFLDLPKHAQAFSGTYYESRLPWILPGYFIYKILPHLVANYALHLGVYYLSATSLYITLKLIFNNRTALLTALIMGSYVWFLGAVGWDYVDGAGNSYLLLIIMFLTMAVKLTRWRILLICAGVGFAALIYTNLFLLIFSPFLATYYLLINRVYRKNNLIVSLFFFSTGVLLMTVLLAVVNKYLVGHFIFFQPSMDTISSLLKQQNQWKISDYFWLKHALWLVWPTIIALASIFFVLRKWLNKSEFLNKSVVFFPALFVILFLLFLLMNLTPYAPVLQFSFYASYLMPFMFLAMGALLVDPLKKLTRGKYLIFLISLSCFLLLGFIVGSSGVTPILTTGIYPIILPMILCSISFICLLFFGKIKLLFFLIFISMSNASLFGINMPPQIQLSNLSWNSSFKAKDGFLAVVDSMKIIQKFNNESDAWFWYNKDSDPSISIYRSISSTYLWGYRLINEEFPRLPVNNLLKPGIKIIVLSQDTKGMQKAVDTLKNIGLGLRNIARLPINRGRNVFSINIFEVTRLSE